MQVVVRYVHNQNMLIIFGDNYEYDVVLIRGMTHSPQARFLSGKVTVREGVDCDLCHVGGGVVHSSRQARGVHYALGLDRDQVLVALLHGIDGAGEGAQAGNVAHVIVVVEANAEGGWNV